jgi:lysophospholipase L1-like esterase
LFKLTFTPLLIFCASLYALAQNTISILPIGTSITYGIGSSDGNSYRKVLFEKLLSQGFTVSILGSQKNGNLQQANNEGYPGKTITFLQDSIVPKISTLKPDYILLEIGVNDMSFPIEPENAPFRLSNLLDKIASACPDAKILLASISPIWTNRILDYNKSLPGVVELKQKQGMKLYLCDMYNAGIVINDVPDAIHPNDAGYAKMGNVWFDAILSIERKTKLPTTPSNVSVLAGPRQNIVRWNSAFQSKSYKIKRSLSASGVFKEVAKVTKNYWWVDTAVANNNTYYYQVNAINDDGESETSTTVNATPAENLGILINCGGGKSAGFAEDFGYEGGERSNWYWDKINLKNVPNQNAIFVYKTGRQGSFVYKIQNLDPAKFYSIKLHFVEGTFNMPEKRVFDVEINEIKKLANFDIFEKTRTKNLAHIESFYLKPNAKGEFNIRFISEIGDACVNGIEIGN